MPLISEKKSFKDVFPSVRLDDELSLYTDRMKVIRVTKEGDASMIRIYTDSNVLVPKNIIFRLEDVLFKNLFRKYTRSLRILDRYDLGERYDPKTILEVYKESYELELNKYFHREYMVYKNSDVFFTEKGLNIVMEKGGFSSDYGPGLQEYFRKLFCDRFRSPVAVFCDYKDSRAGRFAMEQKHKLELIVNDIKKGLSSSNDDTSSDPYNEIKSSDELLGEKKAKKNKSKENSKKYFKNFDKEEYKKFKTYNKTSDDDADVLWGKNFSEEQITPIEDIDQTSGNIIIEGMICFIEYVPIKSGISTIVKVDITNFEDTITATIFVKNEYLDIFNENIKVNIFVKAAGTAAYSTFDNEVVLTNIIGLKKSTDKRTLRMDNSFKKRVELHCHTVMSEMECVVGINELFERLKLWGHKSVGITDNGVVHSFPDCMKAAKDNDLEVIYGMEAFVVDDFTLPVHNYFPDRNVDFHGSFVVFDLETTGLSTYDKIIEIGAVKISDAKIVDRYSCFVDPEIPIPLNIEELTSINDTMVRGAETIDTVLPDFLKFLEGCIPVAHNADFDLGFISAKAMDLGIITDFTYIDTVHVARMLAPDLKNVKLHTLCKYFGVVLTKHHRAVDDAEATAGVFIKMMERLNEMNVTDLSSLNKIGRLSDDSLKKLHPFRCTLLAANDMGKNNLYKLVSLSHLEYFNGDAPIIPKSILDKHRGGILIGSGNRDGEIYDAFILGRSESEITQIARFYDFIEVQPIENYKHFIDDNKIYIKSNQDLQEMTRRIINLGDMLDIPVTATGDVYFMDPKDDIYRAILLEEKLGQRGKGKDGIRIIPAQYLRTTEEMLESFSFVGDKMAYRITVENTNRIRFMCESISPVRPDTCTPVIPGSDETLKKICYDRAHEIYGDTLPVQVSDRLERELNAIISNGYAVLYIIAQKIVWKSNDDGYLVGSRGSVGSSFAATMAGITEVNPLSPHYLCPKCHYVDFESDIVKQYGGGAGCDMPDLNCPVCHTPLQKLGFDIPFETFLGFEGEEKAPDIDLNFSNEYQNKAHAFSEVIFGKGQTFRAGTMLEVKSKTAIEYTWKFFKHEAERTGDEMIIRRCELRRLASGCINARRTTGQHPGGILVLPIGEDINTFVPIQHPANDVKKNGDIITTHFDFHKIDHNLLKLDLLGHNDPTMIRFLQDLTGIDPTEIPLDSPEVMSLFESTNALGIKPEDIGGTNLGVLGIPEFGTDFAMGMVSEAKPTKFSDLVRIAGLAHGEDVWKNNTQDFIREGKATITTAICTRDDIMTYLISKGMEKRISFKIMERVRRGNGLTPEWEQLMKDHGVPDWYLESCNKIGYMFPKAHAAAYVMMAWRIAYCKIFYPLEYYCAFFSVRADEFDYEKMAMGKDKLSQIINQYRKNTEEKRITKPELKELSIMRIVEEMYARGFEFVPVDIYKAKARYFQIVDNKIMPSFKVIDKIGEVAGENIEIAAADGKFLSKEDLMRRAKIGQTAIDKLDELQIINGLPENNQLSFFDQ